MTLVVDAIAWHQFFFVMFALLTCGFAVGVLFSGNIVRMAFYLVLSLASSAGLFFLAGAEFVGAMQLMIYVGGTLVLLIFGVMLTAQDRFISLKTPAGEWVLSLIIGGTLLALLLAAAFRFPAWQQFATPTAESNETPVTTQADVTPAGKTPDADLEQVAGQLLQLMVTKKFPEATKDFNSKFSQAMTHEKLKETWEAVTAQVGGLREQTAARRSQSGPHIVIDVDCVFEKSPLVFRLAFDQEHKIAGMFFLPPASSQADVTARLGLSLVGIRPDILEGGELTDGMSGYLFPFIIVSVHLLVVLVGAAYMARAKKRRTTTVR